MALIPRVLATRFCVRALFLILLITGDFDAVCAQTRHEKIVFSIPSRSIAAIDLYVAKERGSFRDEGLDVDIVQIRWQRGDGGGAERSSASYQRDLNRHSRVGTQRHSSQSSHCQS